MLTLNQPVKDKAVGILKYTGEQDLKPYNYESQNNYLHYQPSALYAIRANKEGFC